MIERGVVTTAAVRLDGGGQVVIASARYDLPSERGAIEYRVESTRPRPARRGAIPVRPAADGGLPLWLPTVGSGELSGTLRLAPPAGAPPSSASPSPDAVARGLAADRAVGVVAFSGGGVERLQLELARGAGAALIGGRIPFADGPPVVAGLDAAAWPVEDARPWLDLDAAGERPLHRHGHPGAAGGHGHRQRDRRGGRRARLFDAAARRHRRPHESGTTRAAASSSSPCARPPAERSAAGEMAFPGHELALTVAASGLDLSRGPARRRWSAASSRARSPSPASSAAR